MAATMSGVHPASGSAFPLQVPEVLDLVRIKMFQLPGGYRGLSSLNLIGAHVGGKDPYEGAR
jgi:hypothetical protein